MDELLAKFIATQERIASALEKIAANGGGGFVAAPAETTADKPADKPATKAADKPAEKPVEKPAEPEEPASEYTLEQVRAALKEYRAIEGAAAMLEVLKTHGGGATELPGLDEKFYAPIMEAIGSANG